MQQIWEIEWEGFFGWNMWKENCWGEISEGYLREHNEYLLIIHLIWAANVALVSCAFASAWNALKNTLMARVHLTTWK